MGMHIGSTWRPQLNPACTSAMCLFCQTTLICCRFHSAVQRRRSCCDKPCRYFGPGIDAARSFWSTDIRWCTWHQGQVRDCAMDRVVNFRCNVVFCFAWLLAKILHSFLSMLWCWTWKEVVQKDCQARNLKKEDAVDRGRWKKLIKIGWWSGWWVGECFFWYRLAQVVLDKGP